MTTCKIMHDKMLKIACWKINFLETWGMSGLNLAIRIWMGLIFWKSGLTKIVTDEALGFIPYFYPSAETMMLFEYEYSVPLLSIGAAAWLSTLAEIIVSWMLFIGLGTRVASAIFIVMTATIQFTYYQDDAHYMWMLLLAVPLMLGSGRFGIDYFVRKRFL